MICSHEEQMTLITWFESTVGVLAVSPSLLLSQNLIHQQHQILSVDALLCPSKLLWRGHRW